jgi:hypothetical protein
MGQVIPFRPLKEQTVERRLRVRREIDRRKGTVVEDLVDIWFQMTYGWLGGFWGTVNIPDIKRRDR